MGNLQRDFEKMMRMARYPAGISVDPTEAMSEEDAAKWKAMNDEYGDKFKQGFDEIAMLDLEVQGLEVQRVAKQIRKTASGVAETILDQMGGSRRLSAMLGVKSFIRLSSGHPGVAFAWPNRQSSRGNYVEIRLTPADTYDMTFFNVSVRGKKKVKEFNDLYFDNLVDTFERQTGWYLRMASDKSANLQEVFEVTWSPSRKEVTSVHKTHGPERWNTTVHSKFVVSMSEQEYSSALLNLKKRYGKTGPRVEKAAYEYFSTLPGSQKVRLGSKKNPEKRQTPKGWAEDPKPAPKGGQDEKDIGSQTPDGTNKFEKRAGYGDGVVLYALVSQGRLLGATENERLAYSWPFWVRSYGIDPQTKSSAYIAELFDVPLGEAEMLVDVGTKVSRIHPEVAYRKAKPYIGLQSKLAYFDRKTAKTAKKTAKKTASRDWISWTI